ncbi:MAG TPA: COX15/CtaA family protein [Thermoleophilaceae bacterium]|nr:COX15/CtaA family protein [Thermoleophilaceae bacterium]
MTPPPADLAPGTAAGTDRAFRRLALATILATFLLVIVGGVVRVSESGLGCGPAGSGLHGWPFCNGDVVPGLDLNSVIEYSHRALAGIVGLMMATLAVLAWRRYRSQRALVRATAAAAVLVVVQALLGAATVENDLDETLVAAHLGLAMALFALLIYVWRASKPENVGSEPPDGGPRFRPLAVVASGLAFCTIVAGGYMAGTQNYGRADYQLGDGAHHACGKEFPTCNGDFMPFGDTRLVDIHLTHRFFVYLTTFAVIALIVLALRRRPSSGVVRSAWTAAGILAAQLLVGALNVWLEEYEALIVLHLALGTLLWGTLVGLAFQLFRIPKPVESPADVSRQEALTA